MDDKLASLLNRIAVSKLLKAPQLLLLILANKRGAGWNTADLARVTGLDLTTITMAKQSLLKQALIEEHCPERDKRVSKVYLTGKGQIRAEQCWKLLREFGAAEKSIRTASACPAQKLGLAS